jgi:TRAP-type C4-dicarboxylate transport system permease small subunit
MKYTWWILQLLLLLLSIFFLVFGLDLLAAAYRLEDPFTFIMTFFAASFVVLISAALAVTFVIKMIRVYRRIRAPRV